jgi:hypothetical protein
MRHLAIGLIAVAAFAGSSIDAQARDYPYCLISPGYGYPGECGYTSYAQCMASASGRLAGCIVNPRTAFESPPGYGDQQRYRQPRW